MIRGLTDQPPRLPRLGKIRLGEKRENSNGKEYPTALDYFRFDEGAAILAKTFGEKCRSIEPVILPSDREEDYLYSGEFAYRKSGLFCKSTDGENALRVYNKEEPEGAAYVKEHAPETAEGSMFEMPCLLEDCAIRQKGWCKSMARVRVVLPTVPGIGVWEIVTSSRNSIRNIQSTVEFVRSMTGGRVAGVPFRLSLVPQEVQPDGKTKTVYVLRLDYVGTYMTLQRDAKRLASGAVGVLDAGDTDVPDDLVPYGGEPLERVLSGEVEPETDPVPEPEIERSIDFHANGHGKRKAKASEPAVATATAPLTAAQKAQRIAHLKSLIRKSAERQSEDYASLEAFVCAERKVQKLAELPIEVIEEEIAGFEKSAQ